MSLRDHLDSIFEVFSRRQAPRRQGYKPDEISERLRDRILLLIREVFSGKWRPDNWSSPGDHLTEYWEEDMHNKLQHLHGRVKLSDDLQQSGDNHCEAIALRWIRPRRRLGHCSRPRRYRCRCPWRHVRCMSNVWGIFINSPWRSSVAFIM
jgi:hypothetical protein